MSRLSELVRQVSVEVERLKRERDEAQCETARLARANDALCDQIAELRAQVAALLERAA